MAALLQRVLAKNVLGFPSIIRAYATEKPKHFKKSRESQAARRPEAGVGRRFQALKSLGHEIEMDKLKNDVDLGLHEDEYFKNVDSVHAEDNTVKKMGMTPSMKYRMIEQKYFKDMVQKEPNLLTWVAKEKIRYLHHSDPKEWTPEKLAHAFPCSVEGIKKLLRSKWTPNNEEQLKEHDGEVVTGWRHLGSKLGGPLSRKVQEKLLAGELKNGALWEERNILPVRKAKSLPDDGEFFGLLAERAKPWQEDMSKRDVLRLMSTTEKGDTLIGNRWKKSFFRKGNRKFSQVDHSPNSTKVRWKKQGN